MPKLNSGYNTARIYGKKQEKDKYNRNFFLDKNLFFSSNVSRENRHLVMTPKP